MGNDAPSEIPGSPKTVVDSLPSCPYALEPQHLTVPASDKAQAKFRPVPNCVGRLTRACAAAAGGRINPATPARTTTLHNMNKRNRFIGSSLNYVYKVQLLHNHTISFSTNSLQTKTPAAILYRISVVYNTLTFILIVYFSVRGDANLFRL